MPSDDTATQGSTAVADVKELLLAEYEHRFTEMMFHSERYHKQTDFIHLFATVLVGIGALLLANQLPPALQKQSVTDLAVFYLLILIVALILELYLFSTLMESLFMIYLNASRLAAIEERLNELTGRKALVWDSAVIPYFFSPKLFYAKGWLKPNYLVGLWSFLLFGSILAVLTCICSFMVPRAFPYYMAAVVVLGLVHIQQWLALLTTGARVTYLHVNEMSALGEVVPSPARTETASPGPIGPEHWAAWTTFLLGTPVFAVSSLATDSFDFSSGTSFPLLALPSVAIGDTVLIPLFVFLAVRFLRRANPGRRFAAGWLLTCAAVAVAGNGLVHRAWAADPYSGFMDLRRDELSFAGWWHLAFSSAVTALLLLFLAAWYRALRSRDREGFRLGRNAWSVIAAFATLSLVDFAIRHAHVLRTPSWTDAIRGDWPALLPVIVAWSVWIGASLLERTRFSGTGSVSPDPEPA